MTSDTFRLAHIPDGRARHYSEAVIIGFALMHAPPVAVFRKHIAGG